MSRFKRFAHSLASGYVLLGANMLYTLATVPLALHYLGKAEFGLWMLATYVGSFLALMDFGLSASVARILIDHKDERQGGRYGGMIQTGLLVGTAQAALIVVVGVLLAAGMGAWLAVDLEHRHTLQWLMIGQCLVMGLGFATRTFSHVLAAHQRFDITNYAQAVLLGVGLAVAWLGFERGHGVFSILWAQAVGTVLLIVVHLTACVTLGLLPGRGQWGKPNWKDFKSVFAFGSDIFIYALGCQLINASQVILLTRLIGLEAVTVWGVCTRVFVLLQQMIYRIFTYSSSALAEMIVRGEREILARRFRQIVSLSASLSVAAGAVFAVTNKSFVDLWTSGRFTSPLLQPADVKATEDLAQRLVAREDAATRYLWDQLAPETRELVSLQVTTRDQKETVQRLLAADLNRLILSSAPLVAAGVNASNHFPATATASESEAAAALAWHNRHWLEDVLVAEIANSRKARWSRWNDLLLALWLVITVSLHAHTGLVGQAKAFRFMRYIFFLEGAVFVGLTILVHRAGGITGMLGASLFCSLVFSFSYGLWRTVGYFGLSWRELAQWHRESFKLVVWVLPAAAVVGWLTAGLPPLLMLLINGGGVGLWAGLGLWRHGLGGALKSELAKRAPVPLRRVLQRFTPGPSGDS